MNRYLLLVLTMCALVASVAHPGAAGVLHIVTEGGSDVDLVKPGQDANASLIAIMMNDGTVKGQWHDNLAGGRGGNRPIVFHARIICLEVIGNEAWVVGELTQPRAFRGLYAIQGLRDLGVSANDSPDEITSIEFDESSDPCNARHDLQWVWAEYSRGQVRIE